MLSHMKSVAHTVGVWSCFFYMDYMHHLATPLSTAQNAPPRPTLMWIDPWIYVRPGHRWLLLTLVLLMLCLGCGCDVGGAYDQYCDSNSGQCSCRPNVVGRDCTRSVAYLHVEFQLCAIPWENDWYWLSLFSSSWEQINEGSYPLCELFQFQRTCIRLTALILLTELSFLCAN